WDAARRKHGDAAGTRALIEVLLAHRTLPAAALTAAMAAAVSSGVLDPQVIVIEARRAGGRAAPGSEIGAPARHRRPAPAPGAQPPARRGRARRDGRGGRLRRPGPAGDRDRGPPGRRAGRAGDRDRGAGPLRPPGPGPGCLRPAADREQRMNPVSDTAAQAAI